MRRFLTYVLVAVILAATLPARAQTVRLGTEGAFAPFTFFDENGVLSGFDIDLGNEICLRASLSCEWVINDWDTIIDGLLAGKYDAILAGMADTVERRKRVAFSIGYQPGNTAGIYVGTQALIDPATAIIAVQAETVHETHLIAKGYTVRSYPTAGAALDAVLEGEADLVFGSVPFLEKQVFTANRRLVIIGGEPVGSGPTAIAFRKEDIELRALFDDALRDMEADGSLNRLDDKWFAKKTDT